MDLASVVRTYLEVAGEFGRPIHLSKLGLSKSETERVLSALDEDYQISRFVVLTRLADEALSDFPAQSRTYLISGFECSHLSLRPEIQKLLR